jgi:hypothetical protein
MPFCAARCEFSLNQEVTLDQLLAEPWCASEWPVIRVQEEVVRQLATEIRGRSRQPAVTAVGCCDHHPRAFSFLSKRPTIAIRASGNGSCTTCLK